MEDDFNAFVETLKKFDGLNIIATSFDPPWIHFKIDDAKIYSLISSQVLELRDQYGCAILALSNPENPEDTSYQLFFEDGASNTAILVLNKKLNSIIESTPRQAKLKELGLPDLTLVTIRQMAIELKQRHNLTFALVWIENNERDHIAIEGSGSPTQLVGLLSRGTHMAIEWADKSIKFHRPKDDE
jgi:hypothetical protein